MYILKGYSPGTDIYYKDKDTSNCHYLNLSFIRNNQDSEYIIYHSLSTGEHIYYNPFTKECKTVNNLPKDTNSN